ncbi:MAG: hypothetical protein AB1652_07165, partial [Bacillota bacterium]
CAFRAAGSLAAAALCLVPDPSHMSLARTNSSPHFHCLWRGRQSSWATFEKGGPKEVVCFPELMT